MKSWKGWTRYGNTGSVSRAKDATFRHPVIVIDASDFPKDAPEIGSEWMDGDRRVTVISQPLLDTLGIWRTAIQWKNSSALRYTDSLKPIPETATGEVVATVLVEDGAIKSFTLPDDGTYDIIKRGDK